MCLSPIHLINPKKRVSLVGGHLFDLEVPCGECAECLKAKKDEWYFRSYYEAKSTWDKGGYVLFDTLTYRNEDLPHMNDYLPKNMQLSNLINNSCFNVEHYRLFFVNLRRQIDYHYGDHSCVKYFLTAEYGTDPTKTHRPHYHVLFFVVPGENGVLIDPLEFSKLVSKCWSFGRTDGIPYQPPVYVLNHVFGYSYNCDAVHMQSVCNYVSKYITKDSQFSATIESRLNIAFNRLYGENWREDDADEHIMDKYKLLRKQMFQFHRQSHGFGEDFLKYNKLDDVLDTGMISMPDKNNIIKHIPLPGYYSHKLFYDVITGNGKVEFVLNNLGREYKVKHAIKNIELQSTKFRDWVDNMKNYSYYHDGNDKEWYDRIVSRFEELNAGRPMEQFAMYLIMCKGRVKSPAMLDREKNGVYLMDDVLDFYVGSFDPVRQFGPVLYYYGTRSTRRMFGEKFVTDVDLGDVPEWRQNGIPSYMANWVNYKSDVQMIKGYTPSFINRYGGKYSFYGNVVKPDSFKLTYVITDKVDERFKDYDKMWSLYCEAQIDKNCSKQTSYDEKEALKKRLKAAGVYVKNI